MAEIRKEFTNFLDDLDKNIKNQEDLKYIKERSAVFMNVILDHIDFILQLKEDKISEIEEKQNIIQNKLNGIEKDIAEIQQEMYIDDEDNDSSFSGDIYNISTPKKILMKIV